MLNYSPDNRGSCFAYDFFPDSTTWFEVTRNYGEMWLAGWTAAVMLGCGWAALSWRLTEMMAAPRDPMRDCLMPFGGSPRPHRAEVIRLVTGPGSGR